MARLPTPGGDAGNWGNVLNEFLSQSHNTDGTLKADVQTMVALKALDVTAIADKCHTIVAGYYTAGDGGGGVFYYDASSSAADNGGTVIAPTAGSGRWKRIYSGAVNVRWFGAKGDGVTNDQTAFQNVIASADDIYAPTGTYVVDYMTIDRNIRLTGSGRTNTKIKVQSYSTYNSIAYGILCRGASSLTDAVQMSGMEVEIDSAQSGQVGILITRKTYMSDVYVHGAPSDGLYFRSVNSSTEAPYFCRLESVWSKYNGRDGCKITENCNANLFLNCQFTNNTGHGWHQVAEGNGQPSAIYNNVIVSGQVSYNSLHGMYIESGSHLEVYGTYAEFNSQTDGGDPKAGAYKNLQIGANATRCFIVLGEQGTDTNIDTAISIGTNVTNLVRVGGLLISSLDNTTLGYQNQGSGKSLTFNGTAAAQHQVMFREGTADIFRILYNGTPASPSNELLFQSYNASAWTEIMKMTNNGRLSFFGGATQTKQTVTGSRGSNAALASLLTALANLGLITDSTT